MLETDNSRDAIHCVADVNECDLLLRDLERIASWLNDMQVPRQDAADLLHSVRRAVAHQNGLNNSQVAAMTDCSLRTVTKTSAFPEDLIKSTIAGRGSSPLALINTLLRQKRQPLTPLEIAKALAEDKGLQMKEKEVAELYGSSYELCEEGARLGLLVASGEGDGIRYESGMSTYEYANPKQLKDRIEQRLRAAEVLGHPLNDCCKSDIKPIAKRRIPELLARFHQSHQHRPVRVELEKLEKAVFQSQPDVPFGKAGQSAATNFGIVVCVGPACGIENAQMHAMEIMARSDDCENRTIVPTRARLDQARLELFRSSIWPTVWEWHLQQLAEMKPDKDEAFVEMQVSVVCGWYPHAAGRLQSRG